MKKLFSTALACCLLTGALVGCGMTDNNNTNGTNGTDNSNGTGDGSTARGHLLPDNGMNYGVLPDEKGLRDGLAGKGILPDHDSVPYDNGAGTGTMPYNNGYPTQIMPGSR